MSLAKAFDVAVPTATETDVVSVTGDGVKKMLGMTVTGEVGMKFKLKIGSSYEAELRTTDTHPTDHYYDRLQTIANGTVAKITAYHAAGSDKAASATILGS